ncbi:hypothetical protein [Methylobacterium sp. ap11]|uniref:hypothetical protein n=1 Tax=Methylobacterium sp. ap11 TaxID=1761799 RepID=UPI000B86E0AE|nr:hypothetical protein [Methylobacterium sp. ap11]
MSKSETTIVAEARACLTQIGIGVISGRRQPNRHAGISGPANARSRSRSPSHRPPPSGGTTTAAEMQQHGSADFVGTILCHVTTAIHGGGTEPAAGG